MRIWPGRPSPLGATWDGKGVNFAVFSDHATQIDLCLFDSPTSKQESARIPLPEQTDQAWHGYVPGLRTGQLYGFRAKGPYQPHRGHRFNDSKVLLDPYARAIGRDLIWNDAAFGYKIGEPGTDLHIDHQDNAATAAASHRHVHRAGVTCNRWAFGGKVNVQSLHRGAGIKLQWLHTKATAIGSKG